MTKQMKAFLDTIAFSEIGEALLAVSDNGYNVVVGSTAKRPILFTDYSKHPRMMIKSMNSDAAGRYQFLSTYWPAYRKQLKLPDFGKQSQDTWAIQLIRECNAINAVEEGRISTALNLCRSRWASFPASGYGQHENKTVDLLAAFVKAGGVLAAEDQDKLRA